MTPIISFKPDKLIAELPRAFAIVDVETTGMRPDSSRVVDIGIIRIEDGVVTDMFSSLVNPGTRIPRSITAINGISNDDVEDAPAFDDIAHRVAELLDGAVFVAHNAAFDYGFVKSELARSGIAFSPERLCTVKLSRALYPGERSHSLDAIIGRFGFACDDRHRAFPDADVVRQFLELLKREIPADELERAFASILYAGRREFPYDRKLLANLPDGAGVYKFYAADGELLYVGKSKHVRTRVRSHFTDATSSERKLMSKVANIEARSTAGELSALLLEAHEIKRELPTHNRLLRKLREMAAVTEHENEDGYLVPRIETRSALAASPNVLSVFRSVPAARAKLREIAAEHELCERLMGTEKGSRACFAHLLGRCKGACCGKESAEDYNARFRKAFARRRIRTWPFGGTVVIEERSPEGRSAAIAIRDWRVVSATEHFDGEEGEIIPAPGAFDMDTYRILARYLLDPANRRRVKHVSGDVSHADEEGELTYEYEE